MDLVEFNIPKNISKLVPQEKIAYKCHFKQHSSYNRIIFVTFNCIDIDTKKGYQDGSLFNKESDIISHQYQ
ncbi:hypothetical protein [Fulvivirga ligni]|uniref:hypothetical protein n=1 Tax=Fulvivirga ligni TaxID=2904246 RepID=UPI001F257839|nr:hypothetical protein [Fulvivirga ligni]UII20129.1 hypothetical protein LVD16_19985 [Fulvivirga ligni]